MTNRAQSIVRVNQIAGFPVIPVPVCMQVPQAIEHRRENRRIHVPILQMVILAMVAWLTSQFLVGCSEGRSRSNVDMMQRVEAAIRGAGGADALGNEAKSILSNFQVGSDWKASCPAVAKLDSLLNPQRGTDSWIMRDQEYLPNLPAHVVIRFGSHAHYEYVWIFDPAHVPLGKFEGVEHLGGAVYLSKKNQ